MLLPIDFSMPALEYIQLAKSALNWGERHLWQGDVNDYAEGRAFELTTREKMSLKERPAIALLDQIVPSLIKQPAKVDEIRPRVVKVLRTWFADDSARKLEMFRAVSSSPPYNNQWSDRTESDDNKGFQIGLLLQATFSKEDLLVGLDTLREEIETSSSPSNITAASRSILALRQKMESKKAGWKILTEHDEETRKEITIILSSFADASLFSEYTLHCIGEMIVGMLPTKYDLEDTLQDRIWFLALLSTDNDIVGRAENRIRTIIDSHDINDIGRISAVLATIPPDYNHRSIWWHMKEVINTLGIKPNFFTDNIFRNLTDKFTKEQNDGIHEYSAGPICATLDHLLAYAQEDQRGEDILATTDKQKLVSKVLDLYLGLHPRSEGTYRTWMLNLVESVVRTHPGTLTDTSFQSKLNRVFTQPDDSYATDEHTIKRSRLPEKTAMQLLLEAYQNFLKPVVEAEFDIE